MTAPGTLASARSDFGIQQSGLGSAGKTYATAMFWLRDIKTGARAIADSVHRAESFDIVADEYAGVVAEENARNRAAEALRRVIVSRLTLCFQRRAADSGTETP